jgi:hypothetical protein
MKEIPLTQGKTAIIDDEDLPLIDGYKWYAVNNGTHWYAATKVRGLPRNKRLLLMHWLITGKKRIDHIDRDGLNNQKNNLRPFSRAGLNRANSKLNSDNASGYRGVYLVKDTKRTKPWSVYCNGYIGKYKTAEEAAQAYDIAARKRFGEFATLNFSD